MRMSSFACLSLESDASVSTSRSWTEVLTWTIASCFLVACVAFGLHLLELALSSHTSQAATATYQAVVISFSAPNTLAPGETGRVQVEIQNIGTATWLKTGTHYVSLYHWNPMRKIESPSVLAAAGWKAKDQPVVIPGTVKPGQSTTLSFSIQAPMVPGMYHGDFILVAESLARMKSGQFSLDVRVQKPAVLTQSPTVPPQVVVTSPSTSVSVAPDAPRTDWAAELIERSGSEWQIEADDHITLTLGFKNTGTKTWTNDGTNYVSIYAVNGKSERTSLFADQRWISKTHPVRLKEAKVMPGGVGHFVFDLRAPHTPGSYQETFALAAEDAAWLSGGTVSLPIRVPVYAEFIATAPPMDDGAPIAVPNPAGDGRYAAALLLRSVQQLSLSGNGSQEVTFGFKNTGKSVWNTRGMRVKGVTPALAGSLSSVRDNSWLNAAQAVLVQGVTKPGEVGFLTFKVKAPAKRGTYRASFQLVADDQPVDGGDVDIPITVTADGYTDPGSLVPSPASGQSVLTNLAPLNGDLSSLPAEPMIRVGLFKTTDNTMVIRAKYAPVTVLQANGSNVCHLSIGDSATVVFDRSVRAYKLSSGSCTGTSNDVFRFKADDGISPMEIADFSRPVSWLPGANDNTFRSQLELRYTPATDNVWVINELPIEWYLKGIAETSNSSPQEYQRALLTAARTYAMYHVRRGGTKHANESYTVDATYDQVYRGYGAESRDPSVVAAVDATRGQIVTYNGQLAITPYYSRSDGRTRSWTEVWGGGPYPWLVSVFVPWDQGKILWGHGVGMSATGALGMANDGRRYDDILKYFYTGIQLMLVYK